MDGALASSQIVRADGTVEEIPSKRVTELFAGDRVRVATPGGAGYGDPAKRRAAAREEDVASGKVDAAPER